MKTLDDDLNTLSRLNDYRKRAKKLRSDGHKALKSITSQQSANFNGWRTSDDEVEMALVVLVQSRDVAKRREEEEVSELVEKLRGLTLKDLFGVKGEGPSSKEELATVPVLVATRAMHALVTTSKYAFSKATLLCYYRIVREIYSADSPDWSTGGAKAGNGGESTAFMTGECVRAISALARTHKQTASFFRRTYEMYQRREQLLSLEGIEQWRDAEIERVGLSWYISTNAQLGEIALKLPPRKEPQQRIDLEYINEYLKTLSGALAKSIRSAKRDFNAALDEIKKYREEEKAAADEAEKKEQSESRLWRGKDQRFLRSESAHQMARSVVEQAIERAEDALKLCQEGKQPLDSLQKLSDLFAAINCDIKRILEPARRFLGAALDRELTAASATSQPAWDARELVFAASSYGAVTEWRQDERLLRACALLSEAISERGLFPPGRPFHSTANGFSLYASSFEVARGFAQLLHKVEFPVAPQLVSRMLQLFEDNSISLKTYSEVCWHAEDPPVPKRPTLWVTAVALLALERIELMLDHKINEGVLAQFSTLRFDKGEKGPRLEDLSFPDYLLSLVPDDIKNDLPPEQRRKWSIAITLEQMHAHVLNATLPSYYSPARFSGVLYGPPGTGKTTLLEALARSTNLPLVQMTPSDIARAGEQGIEKSAKMIFDALSMLTKAVIIFDEFEPILLKRETNSPEEERSIFTFLTPGMLPKLKKLYEAAKQQGIAYCLVTNHYQKLDEAAIRRGRFDEHIAIYHPDSLSRAGMFLDRLYKHEKVKVLDDNQKRRFDNAIKWTEGVNIQDLSKDFFNVPEKGDLSSKTYAAYVLKNSKGVKHGRVRHDTPPEEDHHDPTPLEEWLGNQERNLTYGSIWEFLKKLPPSSAP